MPKIILCQGLQASGKTTWAKEYCKQNKDWVRVNRDSIRLMLHGKQFDPKYEDLVSNAEQSIVKSAICQGHNVIVDAMHLNEKYINKWKEVMFYSPGSRRVDIEIKKFDVPIEECIYRDFNRKEGRVGSAIICETAAKNNLIPWQHYDKYVCVDLDGTLSNLDHRLHYVKTKPKNWKAFLSGDEVAKDSVNTVIKNWVRELRKEGYGIIIVSGRAVDACGIETQQWLWEHSIPFNYLFMRKAGDYREDWIVKTDILNMLLKSGLTKEKIAFSIDDRLQVINRCWRANGIKCYGVSESGGDY